MKLSASQAAKKVGKSVPTITRAIKNGKLSAFKREGGGYEIDPSELFRVWNAISNDSDVTLTMLGDETPNNSDILQQEIELLREQVADLKSDRDEWRKQAQKVTALIEDNRQRRSVWARLIGK